MDWGINKPNDQNLKSLSDKKFFGIIYDVYNISK